MTGANDLQFWSRFWLAGRWRAAVLAVLLAASGGQLALAERISNDTAVFAILDKVTARTTRLAIKVNETAEFGPLTITPRVCYSREPIDPPKTTSFVQINQKKLSGGEERIFSGWMFAESPGLNPFQHEVMDVWLIACKTSSGEASTDKAK